jgi:predicted DNA-binding ribbon-helix-helix protein
LNLSSAIRLFVLDYYRGAGAKTLPDRKLRGAVAGA